MPWRQEAGPVFRHYGLETLFFTFAFNVYLEFIPGYNTAQCTHAVRRPDAEAVCAAR